MPDIIRLLPESIANQIAAGEVVQRPASVVKELLENAIDANSTQVDVFIKEAGKALIQVTDNGVGMSNSDARMCFERHATSKISTVKDIYALHTMGFRGEAMASIAAVAQVELQTRKYDDETGTSIVVEGGQLTAHEPVACNPGTTAAVKNLFYNVPARRNFLRSNAVEMRHIVDDFIRVALANPLVAMNLHHDAHQLYQLSAGKVAKRIIEIYGRSYQDALIPCEEETAHIRIQGYIGDPSKAKKTRGEQFFFINNRYIRNNYLNHAVLGAYEDILPENTFPFYALYIDIDPATIDVNVHPTKTEVKLSDERNAYAIIRAAIKRALGARYITPDIDLGKLISINPENPEQGPGSGQEHAQNSGFSNPNKSYEQFRQSYHKNANLSNWEKLYDDEAGAVQRDIDNTPQQEDPLTLGSAVNSLTDSSQHRPPQNPKEQLFQIHRSYIAVQVRSGMMLVDQQAAHERIIYEKMITQLEGAHGFSQQTLFPQRLQMSTGDILLLKDLAEELKALGFNFSFIDECTVDVTGVPQEMKGGEELETLEMLVEQFKGQQDVLLPRYHEKLARSMAKRMAIRQNQKMEMQDMSVMVEKLFACKQPNYTPDGRATFFILGLDQIETLFKR